MGWNRETFLILHRIQLLNGNSDLSGLVGRKVPTWCPFYFFWSWPNCSLEIVLKLLAGFQWGFPPETVGWLHLRADLIAVWSSMEACRVYIQKFQDFFFKSSQGSLFEELKENMMLFCWRRSGQLWKDILISAQGPIGRYSCIWRVRRGMKRHPNLCPRSCGYGKELWIYWKCYKAEIILSVQGPIRRSSLN